MKRVVEVNETDDISEEKTNDGMRRLERRKLQEMVKSMSRDQMEMIIECIPIDICLARIQDEFNKNQQFINQVKGVVNVLQEKKDV